MEGGREGEQEEEEGEEGKLGRGWGARRVGGEGVGGGRVVG